MSYLDLSISALICVLLFKIFSPKVKVLKQLQDMPEHQGLTLHFVEDRLATLKNVIKEPELDKWNLYLGNYGSFGFGDPSFSHLLVWCIVSISETS
ncbi:uncharacterized protein LOC111385513 [Olea europaea subsp. europaea]|uniref:Uncharacterized protein LOC111385513 n=1 Tax=Olea europaea subsp. europaea TaxID=158383 RepID=A0A8S0SBA5_OLEEU|nr:uncharacterized protein LOC111385513 [Olea europaea subsp. europaea]